MSSTIQNVEDDETVSKKEPNSPGDSTYDLDWLKGTSAESILKNKDTNNKKSDFSDPIYKKISLLNGQINSMSMANLVDSLKKLKLDSRGKKEVLSKRLKNYHKQLQLNRTNLSDSKSKNKPRLDFICVIDFEATCSATSNGTSYPHEIIEFPIVLINVKTLQIEDKFFQSYCKPEINPKLSEFCTSLTGITQDKVDNAPLFPEVLLKAQKWFEENELGTTYTYAIATDGPWDMQNFMNLQCSHNELNFPQWAREWIDVRKIFSNWFNVRKCGIQKMLAFFDLEFEGQQHCGLDDARNIARILIQVLKDGCLPKINSKIKAPLTKIGAANENEDDSSEEDEEIVFKD